MTISRIKNYAAFLGASGVGMGAIAAHALQSKLVQRNMLDAWKTAVLYQLFHATALVGLAGLSEASPLHKQAKLERAAACWAIGTSLFSGSIYLLCFNMVPKKIVGPVTPIGGFIMVAGWVFLGL